MTDLRWVRWVVVGWAIGALAAACESSDGTTAAPAADVPTAEVGEVASAPGTGPPSACGGVSEGTWATASGAGGASSFFLDVGGDEARLDMTAKDGRDTLLLAYVAREQGATYLSLEDGGKALAVGEIPESRYGAVSGAVFEDHIHGLAGGTIRKGRLCFDAAPATGQALAGSFVFVVRGTDRKTKELADFRVQGTFDIPGAEVQATGTSLTVNATAATVTVQ